MDALQHLKWYIREKKKYWIGVQKENVKKIHVGFIGCGVHATENLYPCLRYVPVTLQSICARHNLHAQRNAHWFGAKKIYTDYKEMLQKENLDAVFISVHREKHKEMAITALQQGFHVFLEKPPAMTTEDIEELQQFSEQKKKLCMVGFQKRYAPTYQKAYELSTTSLFEKTAIHYRFLAGNTDSEEEFLYDIGIHAFDLLRYFHGDINELFVQKNCRNGYTLSITLRFKSGTIGSLVLRSASSWETPSERLELYGKEETIVVDNMYSLYIYKKTGIPHGMPSDTHGHFWAPNFTLPIPQNQSLFLNGYGYEVQAFINAIKTEKYKEVLNPIRESKQDIEIIQKILEKKESSFTLQLRQSP